MMSTPAESTLPGFFSGSFFSVHDHTPLMPILESRLSTILARFSLSFVSVSTIAETSPESIRSMVTSCLGVSSICPSFPSPSSKPRGTAFLSPPFGRTLFVSA